MKIIVLILAVSLFALSQVSNGDSWKFDRDKVESHHEFGDTMIVKTVDATSDQKYPDFILDVYRKGELLAKYRGVSFQDIFAILDDTVFVGLSNDGLPGTAVVIFDNKGNLKVELKHHLGSFEYCDKSITRERHWYSKEDPDLRVEYGQENDVKGEITFNDCNGKRVSLIDVVGAAYNKSLQRTSR